MLNKDEYNQEEYNDYYRQETEGAELGSSNDEESGLMSKIIILLVIVALAIAGYFGYKAMSSTSENNDIDTSLKVSAESSLPQSVQVETEKIVIAEEVAPIKEEVKIAEVNTNETAETDKVVDAQEPTTSQAAVTTEVMKAVENKEKLSAEEIARVVGAVMKQMNEQKASKSSSSSEPLTAAVKQDIELMDKLSDSEVDSVSQDLINELENAVDINEDTQVDNGKKQVDVYNKVNVQNTSGSDTLSKLSDEINSVIKEGIKKDKSANYTESLKSEVDVRQNEMRIIVVRKGDTLGQIAKRAYGNVMEYKKIYKANPELTRPDRIYIGQKLRIPND
ncbi:MAG: Unknown protein [uncultured Sulfurovum sp.]|uniref:LysM domain-containing protein n=1 Tax=uncultured Sulfurovum sp. TaxID=269237 RepID=A0A6S6TAE4_9BACT|nr:MAG: Unknown protein [uncultured Sulfurovum sp.]